MTVRILHGNCLDLLPVLVAEGVRVHSVVTDPPYHLTTGKKSGTGFMGKAWDGGNIAMRPETWRLVFDVLFPGGWLLAFGGTRTFHRMMCAIEDAGFEQRDTLIWLYGTGFPKSHDVSKGIDKTLGAEREIIGRTARHVSGKPDQRTSGLSGSSTFAESVGMGAFLTAPGSPQAATWEGWGTALKPAFEPIALFRKPLEKGLTVAQNVLKWGTGALNIDACRIETDENLNGGAYAKNPTERDQMWGAEAGNSMRRGNAGDYVAPVGRWPANIVHDGSDEVVAAFPDAKGQQGDLDETGRARPSKNAFGDMAPPRRRPARKDSGSAARFFYSAKADASDRVGSKHPTVKPTDLMRYLVQLVTPPGGTVLDPFAGTGSTGLAADQLGFNAILVEQDATYVADAQRKVTSDCPMFASVV